jgi:hypothetical protein
MASVHVTIHLTEHEQLSGELVGPDGAARPFAGWMELVGLIETQRLSTPAMRSGHSRRVGGCRGRRGA